jgi:hypothetical protein
MAHPSTDYMTLGRGIISIAEFSGGAPGAYADVGNCPRFDVTLTKEQLEHQSSRSGLKTKDLVITLSVGYSLEFELDEISQANMAKFFSGTIVGPRIRGLMDTDKDYAIKFVTADPRGLRNFTYEFHKVKLSPTSAFALIGDDWSKLGFKAEGQSDTVNHADSPYFDILQMTTTTT